MNISLSVLVLASIFAAGCASVDKVVLDSTPRPATTQIDVFSVVESPAGKTIAELTFLGPAQDELRAQRYFIKQAQQLGGNAIVLWKTAGNLGIAGFGAFATVETKYLFHAKVLIYDHTHKLGKGDT